MNGLYRRKKDKIIRYSGVLQSSVDVGDFGPPDGFVSRNGSEGLGRGILASGNTEVTMLSELVRN